MLENLRKLRESAGITQRQLAERVAVSQQSINKYENHNIEPDIATLIRMADTFHTSVDYLIGHSSEWVTEHPIDGEAIKEMQLLGYFRKLSTKQKECILSIMDDLASL